MGLLSDHLLSLVYPQNCKLCSDPVLSSSDWIICDACWKDAAPVSPESLCFKCGSRLDGTPAPGIEVFCRKCADDQYDRAVAVGPYEKALAASVIALKSTPHVCGRLQRLLIDAFHKSGFSGVTQIQPVPLSISRLKERGFNQALLVAEAISKHTGIPVDDRSLVRSLHTAQNRAGMDKLARLESVSGAFRVTRKADLAGRVVLLVDDIFTSGATVSSCAKVLKEAGAEKVFVLTVARAQ